MVTLSNTTYTYHIYHQEPGKNDSSAFLVGSTETEYQAEKAIAVFCEQSLHGNQGYYYVVTGLMLPEKYTQKAISKIYTLRLNIKKFLAIPLDQGRYNCFLNYRG